jgi:DNA-binding MarR family transcriptional regulator
MSKRPGDRDAAELAVRLSMAMTRLRSRGREEAGQTSSGFTLSQLLILQRVLEGGPATSAAMAAAEHVSHQSIAQSVAILKEAGLVEGVPDARDGRKILITVTDVGRKLFESLMASRHAWLAQAIEATIEPTQRVRVEETIELLEQLASAQTGDGTR